MCFGIFVGGKSVIRFVEIVPRGIICYIAPAGSSIFEQLLSALYTINCKHDTLIVVVSQVASD